MDEHARSSTTAKGPTVVTKGAVDTSIILLTGSPSLETANNAVELGAFRYLTKPVNKDELETAVEHALVARRVALLKRDASAAVSK